MPSRSRRRPLPRLLAGLGVAALAVVAGLSLAVPAASAHDELVSSDPAAGAVLASAPAVITLGFSAELLTEGAQMEVTGPSGSSAADGGPVVEGATLRQALAPATEDGAYRVLWRVVSSDGHPISGEFSFTVEAPDAAPSAGPTASGSASAPPPTATASTAPEPDPTATPLAADDAAAGDADSGPTGLVVTLVVVAVGLGVASAVVVAVVLRRRTR